ncbi:MAG TPA: hypothetical protein VGP03_04535 [Pseudonocardiaceae bacterium]|jgi:hypothetical protein|nr:hypothetical protein [Pseudonocardiaceae bacterium]
MNMSEADPYGSPYHLVRLPGQEQPDLSQFTVWPPPMPEVGAHETVPTPPATVRAAFWCWIAASLLVVVGLPFVIWLSRVRLARSIYNGSLADPQPMTMAQAELGAAFAVVGFALGFAALSTPYLIAAVKQRSGHNWARVLLSVLGALGVLFGLFMLLNLTVDDLWASSWVAGVAVALLMIGCTIVGMALMFLPASNHYVAAVKV